MDVKEEILFFLLKYLKYSSVKGLCFSYKTRPEEVLGELFIRLTQTNINKIRDVEHWVMKSAKGHLKNILSKEAKYQIQFDKE